MKQEVIHLLQKEIDAEHIPGAVVQVNHDGAIMLEEALGYRQVYPEKEEMKRTTMFDLASLTKVVATMTAILKLLDRGIVRLEDKVERFIPSFSDGQKSDITLRHLLTHVSGYQAHLPIDKSVHVDKDTCLQIILNEPLVHQIEEKVIYSDINYALLYIVMEEITKESFAVFTKREIFEPLHMHHTIYNPSEEKYSFAATEYSDQVKDYKLGLVHDENTYAMGGVSGHAGLFSTVGDLGNFANMILQEGVFDHKTFLSAHALRLARQNFTSFDRLYRGIGWELNGQYAASCGDYFSAQSFGHTGFTGTSIWFDPEVSVSVILLTNRVHFGRKNHLLSLRPRLHNVIRKYFN